MQHPMKFAIFAAAAAACGATLCCAQHSELVVNGSFEQCRAQPGAPDEWATTGNPAIHQQLLVDTGRDGQRCAKLVCTQSAGDDADLHAAFCQVGKIAAHQGEWFRLAFWAKSEGIRDAIAEVVLKKQELAGFDQRFRTSPNWERYEFQFCAPGDMAAPMSRLEFSFRGTGTLWLDDVTLEPIGDDGQWLPQIATEGVKNFVPNSSFECGGANWGSMAKGLSDRGGDLYRLEGEVDGTVASHGQHSLKIALTPQTLPVFWMDYYEPVRQPVRRVLVANRGWFHVQRGETLTLSANLRADGEGVAAQLVAHDNGNHVLRKQVSVGTQWQRCEVTFAPELPSLFIAVGLDLEASRRNAATLWIDAIQLERGDHATAYEPRQPVESFVETEVAGNTFKEVEKGASFTVRAFNDTDHEQALVGKLAATDFFDRAAFECQPALKIPAHSGASATVDDLAKGRRGFFRTEWRTGNAVQSLRCAILEPLNRQAVDSPFGFNHAYPWDFLMRLARDAGIVWWRNWAASWQAVEPERGRFNFATADEQIRRVSEFDGEVALLLPQPSAAWSTTGRVGDPEKAANKGAYPPARTSLAYAPKDLNDFARYAAETVRRCSQNQPRSVNWYQVLNEPIYTSLALPRQFGYSLDDYLKLLQTAARAMKSADPKCHVVCGLSANLENELTRDFITRGGLQFVDAFDLHIYDRPRPAEDYDDAFRSLEELMRAHGGPKPTWISEWGCYADDDPPTTPQIVGDATMNRCLWPSERAASEQIVKFTAIAFAHGVRKIFFYTGKCGTINGPDAASVLFEYGGAPRKMLPTVSAFTRLLGVPDEFLKSVRDGGIDAYVFRVKDRAVAIAWRETGKASSLKPAQGVTIDDIMGNELSASDAVLGESPIYVTAASADAILATLAR